MSQTLTTDAILQYRDYATRARSYLELPFGKPGRTLKKSVYGEKYLYREVAVLSGDTRLLKLGPLGSPLVDETDALFHATNWMPAALAHLRELGYYSTARQLEEPLINCFNLGFFAAGAVLIGQLAYLFWLNELGIPASEFAPAAPDLELALRGDLKLSDAQGAFLNRCLASNHSRLHVHFEIEDYSRYLSRLVQLPYQVLLKRQCFMTNLDYLTCDAQTALALVGDYLVPVRLPAAGRVYWQKLYWSRLPDNPRAKQDRLEAMLLGEALAAFMPDELHRAEAELPAQWQSQLATDHRIANLFACRSATAMKL